MPSLKRTLIFSLLALFHLACISLIVMSSLHDHFKVVIYLVQACILFSCLHVFVPVLIFFFRLKSICRSYDHEHSHQLAPITKFIILIPAHNEGRVMPALLNSVSAQNYPQHLVNTVVIADNCSDDTAAVSREMGFECAERFTDAPSNKALAMVFGAEYLRTNHALSDQVVCIIDADCMLDPDYLQALNNMYAAPGAAAVIQSHRSVHNVFHSKVTILDAAAEALRQFVVSGSRKTLGMENFIYGLGSSMRGYIFNELIAETKQSVVEDKVWKVYFSKKRIPVDYCATAQLRYEVVHSNKDFQKQRKRWIIGHLEILRRYGFHMLWQSIKRGNFSQFDFAWELLQPPRSFLFILTFVFGLIALWNSQFSLLPPYGWFFFTISFFLYGALGMWLIKARPIQYIHLFSGLDMILGVFKTTFLSLFGKRAGNWDATRKKDLQKEIAVTNAPVHESETATTG